MNQTAFKALIKEPQIKLIMCLHSGHGGIKNKATITVDEFCRLRFFNVNQSQAGGSLCINLSWIKREIPLKRPL